MRRGTNSPVIAVLDLRGFRRRQPRAALHWHLQHLPAGGLLQLILEPGHGHDTLPVHLCACGGEIIAAEERDGARILSVRRAPAPVVSEELDMRGARCPLPVIEARRRMRRMARGSVLKLRTDCTSAPTEVGAWAANSVQVQLLAQRHEGAAGHVFLIGRQ
ncbi:MAG: sulfurtransferase TusA family protein [Thiohalomonadaceae bacterium]